MNWHMAGTTFLMALAILFACFVLFALFAWLDRFGKWAGLIAIIVIMLIGFPVVVGLTT